MFLKLGNLLPLGTFILASVLVGCNSLSSGTKVVAPQARLLAKSQTLDSITYTPLEKSIYQQINLYRQSHHLPPLQLDSRISQQARIHSQEMASGRVPFGHQGFAERVSAISRAIPYSAAAENVAFNEGYSDPATEAVKGWLKSPGHRTNIEGQYTLTGIGVAKNAKNAYYFTQIFIRPW